MDATTKAVEALRKRASSPMSKVPTKPTKVKPTNSKTPADKKPTKAKPAKKATGKATSKKAQAKKTATKSANKTPAKKAQSFDQVIASAKAKPKKERIKKGPRAFRDPRMPPVGTIMRTVHRVCGKILVVEVCDGYLKPRCRRPDGKPFSRNGYPSPSALISEARGGLNSNGWMWFGLGEFRNGEHINTSGIKVVEEGDISKITKQVKRKPRAKKKGGAK